MLAEALSAAPAVTSLTATTPEEGAHHGHSITAASSTPAAIR